MASFMICDATMMWNNPGYSGGKEVNTMDKDLSRYLWKGLNYDRYEVIRIIPQNRDHAVIVMRCRDEGDHHWCLQYCGNGHYFDTAQQLMDYYHSRKFRKPFGPPL